jgi:hypothetical protein
MTDGGRWILGQAQNDVDNYMIIYVKYKNMLN